MPRRNRKTEPNNGEKRVGQYNTKSKRDGEFQPVSVDERLATCGQPQKPELPIDSSELPWDEIFALRGCPNPDGV